MCVMVREEQWKITWWNRWPKYIHHDHLTGSLPNPMPVNEVIQWLVNKFWAKSQRTPDVLQLLYWLSVPTWWVQQEGFYPTFTEALKMLHTWYDIIIWGRTGLSYIHGHQTWWQLMCVCSTIVLMKEHILYNTQFGHLWTLYRML